MSDEIKKTGYTDVSSTWFSQDDEGSGRVDILGNLHVALCFEYPLPSLWTTNAVAGGVLEKYKDFAVNNAIKMECIERTPIGSGAAQTWSVVTDTPNLVTGRTFVGKPEKYDEGNFTTPYNMKTFGLLTALKDCGVKFNVVYIYDDEANEPDYIYEQWIPHCKFTNIPPTGGAHNASASATVNFQPLGGKLIDFGWTAVARTGYAGPFATVKNLDI